MNVKIYVEGIADARFLQQYIQFQYGVDLGLDSIISIDGWTNISKPEYLTQFQKNNDDGITSLVIFDADNDFNERKTTLLKIALDKGVNFDVFLFPDDISRGALEELLIRITNPQNKSIVECWDRYETDLSKQSIPWRESKRPTTPSIKTRIYAYLEALVGDSKKEKQLIKEANRDYTNTNHWNLNSTALLPLKKFLDKYFLDI